MKVQILGTGYSRCKMLLASVERAVQELGLRAEIEKATELISSAEGTRPADLTVPSIAIPGVTRIWNFVMSSRKQGQSDARPTSRAGHVSLHRQVSRLVNSTRH